MIDTSINLFRSLQITPDSMPPPPRTPSPIFCDTSTPLQDTDQSDPRKLVYMSLLQNEIFYFSDLN